MDERLYNWLILNNRKPAFAQRLVDKEIPHLMRLVNQDLTCASLKRMFVDLKLAGRQESYINRLYDYARLWCHYCEDSGLPYDESILTIRRLKEKRKLRHIFTADEIDRFLNIEPAKNVNRVRFCMWTLYWQVVIFSGLRVGEAGALTKDCLDFSRQVFIVKGETNKTGVGREVAIAPNLIPLLKKHIQYQSTDYLFPSLRDPHSPTIADQAWLADFQMRCKKASLWDSFPRPQPYDLRATWATRNLDENNNNLYIIKDSMGHSRLETTEKYFHYSTASKVRLVENDPLVRQHLDTQKKYDAFREKLLGLIKDYHPHYQLETNEDGLKLEVFKDTVEDR